MKAKITVVGSINYDIVAQADRLPKPGETVNGGAVDIFVGGKGSNQAVQAAKLGCDVHFVGRIGEDEQGSHVRQNLAAQGVNTEFLEVDESARTGCAVIYVEPGGLNMLVHAPGANNQLTKGQLDRAKDVIQKADVFISQNEINQDAVFESLKIAKAAGVTTVLNPAPAVDLPSEIFALIDYFIPNETESDYYTKLDSETMELEKWAEESWKWYREKGVKNLVVTLGSRGAMYTKGEGFVFVPAMKGLNVVDTTAAGDSFIGGFSASLASGLPIEKALYVGNVCGGLATTIIGAQNSIHSTEMINAYLKEKGLEEIEL
jgi:ribokinase